MLNNKIKRKKDCNHLGANLKDRYLRIQELYNTELHNKDNEISLKLKSEIKDFLGDARSIADYCAHDIIDELGILVNGDIYFPIHTKVDVFENKLLVKGIKEKLPELYNLIKSIQPFSNNYEWMGHLATLNNINKHEKLTDQNRTETLSVTLESGMSSISISGVASISLGEGDQIVINGSIIAGPQVISPVSELTNVDPRLNIKKQRFIDFKFMTNDNQELCSVLLLLKKIHDEIPVIIEKMYATLSDIEQGKKHNNE